MKHCTTILLTGSLFIGAMHRTSEWIKRNVMGKGQRYKVVRKHLTCVVIQYSEERSFRHL